ncbi:NAD(P)/FAD-dependent oxidoreductase [Arthrobacter sp. B2a2-09]|uniref:NAD(P)/FAD-dependent oxidoreductase n=1 Tax=Arthrobacter sp. B2a2-09 TaxID=2952822 RepID=UPI0022CDAB74|nr:FAD-dependent oxidoreductase [Arthrobacter sp. B2a2-09]MCZ9882838.1 FAD-dependent oxidoreductase [Arthrobacter sp. B2a2-09]
MDTTAAPTNTHAPRDPRDQHVLVVGASAAGLATAEALRRNGHRGRLTLLDAEPHLPYDRPPLSKQLLSGEWTADRVILRDQKMLDSLDAEFLLGESATSLHVSTRTVTTGSGQEVSADAIVLATGLRARHLPTALGTGDRGAPAGIHVLRTLDDAHRLKEALASTARLVVVGNGVLGCEIAATARQLGVKVTLVGAAEAPMAPQLGALGSRLLAGLHSTHGVQLLGERRVAAVQHSGGRVSGVELTSGEVLPADTVVVAIGSEPVTGWLAGSGLELDDGIVCDTFCRAADGVWAVGDVARWHHAGLGEPVRLENRTNATEQAIAVARDILGKGEPYAPVPYFWTDQYGVRIQVHGLIPGSAQLEVTDGDPADGRFVAVAIDDGRMVGVLGWAMPKQTRQRRQELMAEAGVDVPALN